MGLFCDHDWRDDSYESSLPWGTRKYQHICIKCKKTGKCDKDGEIKYTNMGDECDYYSSCSKCGAVRNKVLPPPGYNPFA